MAYCDTSLVVYSGDIGSTRATRQRIGLPTIEQRTIRRPTQFALQKQSQVAISSDELPEDRENRGFQQRRHRSLWGQPGESRPKARRAQSQNRVLGDGIPQRGPLPTATSLGLAGIFKEMQNRAETMG